MDTPEEWRSTSVPGYEVSNHGRARSWRAPGGGRRRQPKILACTPNGVGYRTFRAGGRGSPWLMVHIEVLTAFVGPRPPGMYGCHDDNDRANCALANLRWDTPQGNSADKLRHDTHQRGERHGQHKLTEDEVRQIRGSTETNRAAAARFGVHPTTVSEIRRRLIWGWLDDAA